MEVSLGSSAESGYCSNLQPVLIHSLRGCECTICSNFHQFKIVKDLRGFQRAGYLLPARTVSDAESTAPISIAANSLCDFDMKDLT